MAFQSNSPLGNANSQGSGARLNKLKIVGSGQNWSVARCDPFYLLDADPPASDANLTGAKNLIEHRRHFSPSPRGMSFM